MFMLVKYTAKYFALHKSRETKVLKKTFSNWRVVLRDQKFRDYILLSRDMSRISSSSPPLKMATFYGSLRPQKSNNDGGWRERKREEKRHQFSRATYFLRDKKCVSGIVVLCFAMINCPED